MNQEKKNSIKWIATFLAILVLFAGVGASLGLVIHQMNMLEQEAPIAIGDGKEMFDGHIYEMPSVLSFSADAMTAADSGYTTSVTLSATVLPVEATNKLVDWSIAWGIANEHTDEQVTDYVTVTPQSDGSNIVTVTCLKAFGDDEIIITVTTRDGGFSASCRVLYAGLPTSMTIVPTGVNVAKDNNWSVDIAEVNSTNTYLFDITLTNGFGVIGNSFTPNYSISAVAYGSIDVKKDTYNANGEYQSTTYETIPYVVQDVFQSNGYIWTSFQKPGGYVSVNKISIVDGKLQVIAQDMPSSYSGTIAGRTGRAEYSFSGYTDNKLPYVSITVTELTTGIMEIINIRTVSGVQSVSLSNTSLSF